MKFTNQQIVDTMKRIGVVPLFTHDNAEEAQRVVEAAYKGGVRVFEFTNRKKNSYDVFVHLLKQRSNYPELMIGIGTVMDGATTKKFIDAGADFIISPIVKLEMAEVCRAHGKLWMPGCATLTEIVTAKENGAEVIKVFPGSVLGPGFISSIMPVVPDLQLMITGGVEPNEKNLSAWFKAGAMCVGMGSQLFTKEILAEKNWKQLENNVQEILGIVKRLRGETL
ncbi:beta/alpha barrel domain-containing protein [Ohtaekwangia koreensis]|uniref:2-dehydro-3-deoxyphosphogluconate aldolase / (4S)-4-hydroxy-2-oxoglutarate aldolase n=1 Tax=Ohtaekwangia koreensis TaxID=688867 RepID=A0A1T5MH11_9BACT|nr:bifunctional 4-hydroxy-2-oxoglutarate aldolase/2-dehydro-3-deoxy-phosphogluconate aldolase [Ohtaekwangia koreensis]SKC87527.1 2-dehydro-3-deoxyphosphogluconate aldolase / (4S)-4-hydroxy-2-oxoglutarate aldolase [Ohtaekwangia koreensis]